MCTLSASLNSPSLSSVTAGAGTEVGAGVGLDVTNGPDLHVILSPLPRPKTRGAVHSEGYVDLGELKGNIGNQNYPIRDDADVSRLRSVVIYCTPFHVIFSVAELTEPG